MRATTSLSLLILSALSIALAGCITDQTPPLTSAVPCSPPTELLTPAPGPAALPDSSLSQKDVVRLWGRDRADYRRETDRHNDLSQFVETQCR